MITTYFIHNIDFLEEAGIANAHGIPSYTKKYYNIAARIEYVTKTDFTVDVQSIAGAATVYIGSGYTIKPRDRFLLRDKYYEVIAVIPQYAFGTAEEYIMLECAEVTVG